ncbi:type IIL restriction-modification enzyme MmeI [Psychrobacter submarinus]|uniref:type IIL restriction-modification enzyme MmeI n=1 Tax=Psychrobacter submarinus TaxID=154108 RepID=UPI0028BD647A|nr:type IIL restriction-modification enzyme MmeI [Psychrobacter submarinus]
MIFKLIDKAWHSENVENIGPYLISGSNIAVESRRKPIHDGSVMVYGSKPVDGGNLILSKEERNELISVEPASEKWLKKLIGSEEFLNSKERWCLWFQDEEIQSLTKYPEIAKRLEAVKQMRFNSEKLSTKKLSATPHLFAENRHPISDRYILVPSVTSSNRLYVPIGFIDSDTIATNLVHVIPDGNLYDFGVLTSLIQNDWMRLVAGRLGIGYRYSGTIVYNTFPFPDATEAQRENIEQLAEEILLARASNAGMTLAELYDPDKMPDDLKQAHSTLDDAVDKLYRPQGFANTEERLAHLLARYEQLIEEEKQSKAKKKAQKKSK